MKKYKMRGGGIIRGETAQEVVEHLRLRSFNPGDCLQEYMDKTAEACILYNGASIRHDTHENFVADLIKYGFLVEE
jgi:uncharacterized protein YuzB (UPF0349 family)